MKQRYGFSLGAWLFYHSFCLASPHAVTVYGLDMGSHLVLKPRPDTHYWLQIGAFHQKENAIDCQQKWAKKTERPVQIISPRNGQHVYSVVIGPFADPNALKTESQHLHGKSMAIVKHPVSTYANTVAPLKKQANESIKSSHVLPIKKQEKSKIKTKTISSKQETFKLPSLSKKGANPPSLIIAPKPLKKIAVSTENIYSQPMGFLKNNTVLLDKQTIQANQISEAMRTTRKMHLMANTNRESIENKTWELQRELSVLEAKLQAEVNAQERAKLEKRQQALKQEMNTIVNQVIQRVSLHSKPPAYG